MVYLEQKVLEYGLIQPEKIAIGFKRKQVTYGELRKSVLKAANYMKKHGIVKGNIVLLQAITDSDYIISYLSLHYIGAIVVPVERKATLETIELIKKQLGTDYIIGTEKFIAELSNGISYKELETEEKELEEVVEEFVENDIYDILFTTGTTGQAKGVVTTRKSVLSAIANEIEGANVTASEVLLIPIPLNHSFGLGKLRATLYLGATVVLQNGVSMIAELKKNVEQFQCTAMICVPSALSIISGQAGERLGEVLGGLHFIEVASAPFGIELKENLKQLLPEVHILNRYGSTETPAAVYLDIKEAPDKLASIGKAVSRVAVKIVDDNGVEIKSSKENIGKLAIAGPMVMQGYYNAEALTNSVLRDGWLYSKDMAYIDEDGYIFLMGRDDDVINTGGKKFSPVEVEAILMKSGLIKECAVSAIPDPQEILGNVPVLVYVAVTEEVQEIEIEVYLKKNIEKYKLPVKYMRVNSLPRNYMGKLERNKIKKIALEE